MVAEPEVAGFPSTPPSWGGSSLAADLEKAKASESAAKVRSQALEQERDLLRAENERLGLALKQAQPSLPDITDADAGIAAPMRTARAQFAKLLGQFQEVSSQLARAQVDVKRLADENRDLTSQLGREKARASAAETTLQSSRQASGRLADEANSERLKAADAVQKSATLEDETKRLREDKRVLEALVRRLDPERVAKLEDAVRERDQLLKSIGGSAVKAATSK